MWQIISDFIGNIFVALGVFLFAKIVLNSHIKITKCRLIIDFVFSIVVYTLIMFYFDGIIKTFLMAITMILFVKDAFKTSSVKTTFLIFLYITILIVPDLFQLFFMTEILQLNKDFCYTFAGSIVSNVTVLIVLISITYIIRKPLRKLINTKVANNTKIIIFSILSLISILMFFYTIISEFRFNDNILLYLVSITVIIIVLFSLIKQTIENNKLTSEYDKLLEFMMTYENEIEKQRILRHEIKNEFRTIRAKICDNQQNKEIIEYIDEIVNDKYEINKEKYAKFGYLPPNGIKGLCYFKTQEAESKGIKVSLNISKRIKNSTIYSLNVKQQRDFGRILGVFLDNAIEASAETKEKKIGIEAYVNIEQEFKIIISNTYNNKIDKEKIGIESFSTKGKNRGHGLLLVKQLVNKNDIFKIKTNLENNIYIQTIEIKKL